MRLLCVDKGLSFAFKQHLMKFKTSSVQTTHQQPQEVELSNDQLENNTKLGSNGNNNDYNLENTKLETMIIQVAEPTSSDLDYEQEEVFMESIGKIEKAILEFDPHVLLFSSRGGKYACKLLKDHVWEGPCVMISTLIVSSMIDFEETNATLVFAYGQEEKTVPFPMIQHLKQCHNNRVVVLSYANESHSMNTLVNLEKEEDFNLQHGIEQVKTLTQEYREKEDDVVFEEKQLSLLQLVYLSWCIANQCEKKRIVKNAKLLQSASSTSSHLDLRPQGAPSFMLNPSMLKGGFNQLRKI
ncbi:hypothetical protein FDP41_009424 [Naegleria fowleri]|uniref:Uncharacterized protein n=1 Tax=Naegleria fowleri TaxID=5763 RepID=A0A6A5BCZ3_NAEFO|nr:uncharacterized protein FDP41_009424 [Naegleria fowleri]KAF0972521.1 hypothetical protein FDP41_009424 [Naegleria fowleri]CAG4719604.1 unnamed protein product [Naegleria fowleri]